MADDDRLEAKLSQASEKDFLNEKCSGRPSVEGSNMKATNGGYHRQGEKAVSLNPLSGHGPHRCQDSPSVPSSEWANLRPFQTR